MDGTDTAGLWEPDGPLYVSRGESTTSIQITGCSSLFKICATGHKYAINGSYISGELREYDLICERCGDARTVIPTRA